MNGRSVPRTELRGPVHGISLLLHSSSPAKQEPNAVPPTEPTRSRPARGSLRERLQWPLFLTGIILWVAAMVALILFGLDVI